MEQELADVSTSWKRGSKTKHLGQEEFDVLMFV